jgi:hypothetical protein
MTINTNEPTKGACQHGTSNFGKFQVDEKDIKVLFNGRGNMNICFLQLESLPVKF